MGFFGDASARLVAAITRAIARIENLFITALRLGKMPPQTSRLTETPDECQSRLVDRKFGLSLTCARRAEPVPWCSSPPFSPPLPTGRRHVRSAPKPAKLRPLSPVLCLEFWPMDAGVVEAVTDPFLPPRLPKPVNPAPNAILEPVGMLA